MNPERARRLYARFVPTPVASKVPDVDGLFWLLKVLSTALGEATSDALVHQLGGPLAVLIGFAVFAAAMVLQFSVRQYRVLVYWFSVAMVGVFGTMAADVLHVGLGVPYALSASLYLCILIVVFAAWQKVEGTLSIHSITTTRREGFYWLAVLAAFAMGTALGDLSATTWTLGYNGSALLFAGLMLAPGVAYYFWRKRAVLIFWVSYVLARPVGASVADWLGMPHNHHGLGYGAAKVAVIAWGCYVVVVAVRWRMTPRPR